MKEKGNDNRDAPGRYLEKSRQRPVRRRGPGQCLSVILLLVWDGLLLYMIVACLIEPAYGAAFVAVVSVYLGKKL